MSAAVRLTALWPLAPPGSATALVRLAPDGTRLAFARTAGDTAGIYVCDAIAGPAVASRSVSGPGGGFAPVTDALRSEPRGVQLVSDPGLRLRELCWAPDGEHLAFLLVSDPSGGGGTAVGWCSSRNPGEIGRLPGASFAWTRASTGLVVAAPDLGHLVHRAIGEDRTRRLALLDDDGDPRFPPRLAVSRHEPVIAFTSRSLLHGISELHIAERHGGDFATRVLTEIPGTEAHVFPFWAPGAPHLAFFAVHGEYRKSAIIAVPRLKGDGVVLYERHGLDPAQCPAWSPSGRTIALLSSAAVPPAEPDPEPGHDLVLVDCRARTTTVVSGAGKLRGRLTFVDEHRLLVEGDTNVTVVDLPITA